ncbi:MAG: hypothetical protein MJ232_02065 [archaeon]|nr:hypothetical protein [archaeon]
MSYGVVKEQLHSIEEFIAESLKTHDEQKAKIDSGNYSEEDIFDYECLNYNISGMFIMLNLLSFEYQIRVRDKLYQVILKSQTKSIDFSHVESFTKRVMDVLRLEQIKILKSNPDNIFDNIYLNETKQFMFIYYYYGIKTIASFFDINIDGKINAPKTITIGDTNQVQKDITDLRRYIANLVILAKSKIETYSKIKITNVRINVLEIRKTRTKLYNSISDRTLKVSYDDEIKYINSRINFFNTELIKLRTTLSSKDEELNKELKNICEKYLGINMSNFNDISNQAIKPIEDKLNLEKARVDARVMAPNIENENQNSENNDGNNN